MTMNDRKTTIGASDIVVMDVIRKRESVLLVVRARNLEGQEIT